MAWVSTLFQLLGALGIFLFGMKVMSEGLQKVAGDRMKSLLARITGNRFSGVLTGLTVTCVVQSSSATTVMVVGFVTAGLLTLTQAIGVIMGANIGTTLTGWLVAVLGFKVKITAFALQACGVGFAMSFLKGARVRQWGEALLGFGLLFIGLGLLKDAVPDIGSPEDLAWVQAVSGYGFGSVVLFVAIGTLLTVVLQSSSATMTLTLTLAALGWLPYELAAATVLGENIGTTITANLAAIGASRDAVRAARVHFLFNIFGVTWALLLMGLVLLPVIDWMVPGDPNVDFALLQGQDAAVADARSVVTTHLAAFHSVFNVVNTLLMVGFVKQLEKIALRWIKDDDSEAPVERLRFLVAGATFVETPELVLIQVGQELQHIAGITRQMLTDATHILASPDEDLGKLVRITLQREDQIDDMEREIQRHLSLCARAATSAQASRKIAELIQNTHRLERIADHIATLVRIAQRVHDRNQRFSPVEMDKLRDFAAMVGTAMEHSGAYLAGQGDPAAAEAHENAIDARRRELREETIQRMKSGEEGLRRGLAFLDALTHLEEIGDRAVGIIRRAESTAEL